MSEEYEARASRQQTRSRGGEAGGRNDVNAEDASGLIGAIYDAALAPERWPRTLEDCAAFVGGSSAAIFSKRVSGIGGGVYHHDGRVDPDYVESYFREYAPIDPSNTVHLFASVDEVIRTTDFIDREEFLTTRLWLEWSRPQGIVDMVVAPIDKQGTGSALFGVFRSETHGLSDDRASNRLGLLAPHVRRAFTIGRSLHRSRMEAASLGDVLDGLASAVFFVDAAGRVVHANRAGHDMLGNGGAVTMRRSSIISLGRAAGSELGAILTETGIAGEAVDGRSIVVTDDHGERYVAHVLPLTSGERRQAGNRYNAVAALFVQRAALEIPSTPEALAKAFELTPSELRVLLSIVEVGGVPETAVRLGIAESTVKTHLHRVFGKTETTRQADLARLMAAYASPLRRTAKAGAA